MSSMQSRRSSSTMAKRNVTRSTSENSVVGKVGAAKSSGNVTKKRPPLSNLTNQKVSGSRGLAPSSTLVPCSNKIARAKKNTSTTTIHNSIAPAKNPLSGLSNSRPTVDVTKPVLLVSDPIIPRSKIENAASRSTTLLIPRGMDDSPSRSDDLSVSMDESISTCDSFRSPDVEYVDNNNVNAVTSLERKTFSDLCISEHGRSKGNVCSRDVSVDMEVDDEVSCVDENTTDPQLCATYACDIYHHLRASEAKKRPSVDFMEKVQKDINASMRSILIDWLVEVAEEYRLVPDTLYLTVNYIDRYLSGNTMNRQRLQLLGVACMMIASKYEEICAPQVEEFCYITDNTYFKEEVLEMESSVLNYLKFEMTAPTAKCFLRRFVRAAQGADEVPSLQLECMANYVVELSLLEYSMLCYAPSLIAASSIFLAKYILFPSKRPWTSTLGHYTLYKPSDLQECVLALHQLCRDTHHSNLPAIREKYSQHKYKFVAKKYCPPSIPPEFFHNISSTSVKINDLLV